MLLRRPIPLRDVDPFTAPEASRLLFEHNPLPMFICDPKTLEILALNGAAQELYGYTRPEFLALTLVDIRPAEDRARFLADHRDTPQGLRCWGQWRHQAKCGAVMDVEITTNDFTLGGRLLRHVSIQVITAQKQLEEQFRQAQKMETVGRLAGGVAHDFNNLLSVINGYCDLLLLAPPGADPAAQAQRRQLEEIHKAGARAVALTRQLLTLSRQHAPTRSVFRLNDCVTGFASMLRRMIGEDVALTLALDPSAGSIEADRGQIEQVLMNLAVNARDAMPQGGHLIFETQPVDLAACSGGSSAGLAAGAYVQLTATDSGMGMEEATRAHIFEPFFSTKGEKGTGLGLSTVATIIANCGGSITVQSEPGHGASFIIRLPRHQGLSAATPQG